MKEAKAAPRLAFLEIRDKPAFCLTTRFSHKEQAMYYVGVDLHKKSSTKVVPKSADQ